MPRDVLDDSQAHPGHLTIRRQFDGLQIGGPSLRDLGLAKVIGTATAGNTPATSLLRLSDGSGIVITVAHWLPPSGKNPIGGVLPDVRVKQTEEAKKQGLDPPLQAGKALLSASQM